MTKNIDLNAELREWLGRRLSEALGDNPDNIYHVMLNIHEAKDDIFRLFYDYQVVRGWPHVATNTANILGFDERTVRRLQKNVRRIRFGQNVR